MTSIEGTLAATTTAAIQLIPAVDSADILIITESDEHRSLAATSPLPQPLRPL